uniref:Uncharacterized protein n=1 Tax=Oryza rufipogon TaxID=4529 RepID=A0A0E0Q3C6_ORYRU
MVTEWPIESWDVRRRWRRRLGGRSGEANKPVVREHAYSSITRRRRRWSSCPASGDAKRANDGESPKKINNLATCTVTVRWATPLARIQGPTCH